MTSNPLNVAGYKITSIVKRWSGGVAMFQNYFGYPGFLFYGGRTKIGDGQWEASSRGEFLFVDADNPTDFSHHDIR